MRDADPSEHAVDVARAAVRADVAGRSPVDARERSSIAAFLQHFDRLERPFDEHADPVHVTGSALVVGARGVVLHRHKRLGRWLQPGGHIEAGESPSDAALRETLEETGLPVGFAGGVRQLVHVDVHPGPRGHTHLDLRYLLESPAVPPAPATGESQDVQWFPWYRAIAIADAGLEGALRALQPGLPAVRAARVNDAGELAAVFVRSRAFDVAEVPCVLRPKEVKAWFADEVIGHREVTVAEVDGTVVALVVLDRGVGATGWIDQLCVDPAWSGRGLDDRLLEIARHRFPAGLQRWIFQADASAREFVERHRFSVAETTDGRGNAERAPDVRYEWIP